ncbi:MAG: hypothetical protein JNJ90_15815 [Saprospiraceae bacterium]|jgi:hypothetical protein|nr:hypothetical protein [Saprospiraceae bacterium]
MKNSKAIKVGVVVGILLLIFWLIPFDASAQCPMCRMSAESNLKNGGTDGRGLNAGILYMLAMPYLLVVSIGYWWWRNRKKAIHHDTASGLAEFEPGREN